MTQQDLDDIDIKEELEFNDGFGDVLTEKDHYKFSWKKTLFVVSIGLISVIMLTFGILEIGKVVLNLNENQYVEAKDESIEEVMADVNNNTWNVLPDEEEVIAVEPVANTEQVIESKPVLKEPVIELEQPVVITAPQPPVIQPEIKPVVSIAPEKKVVKVKEPEAPKKVGYRVIAGSFSQYSNATSKLSELKRKGFDGYVWSLTSAENKVAYKVQVGAFSSRSKAELLIKQLNKKNIQAFISTY